MIEAKDVALLGFISAAKNYVDKHLNDGTNLGEFKNIDFKKLKDELSERLNSLVWSNEKMTFLKNVGEKAFKEYAKDNFETKKSVIDQLGEIFNVSFDDEDNSDDIDNILDAYDLDEKIAVSSSINKPVNDDLDEFGLSSDDDVLMTITNAASLSDEELAKKQIQEIKQPENLDSVFAEVINNEEPKEEIKEELNEESKEEPKEEIKEEEKAEDVLSKAVNEVTNNIDKLDEKSIDILTQAIRKINKNEIKPNTIQSEISEASNLKPQPEDAEVVEVKSSDLEAEMVQAEPEKIYKTTKSTHIPLSSVLKSIGESQAYDTGYYDEPEVKIKEPQENEVYVEPVEEERNELKRIDFEEFKPTFSFPADVKPADSLDILINPGLELLLQQEKENEETYFNTSRNAKQDMSNYTNPGLHEIDELNKAISDLNNLQKKIEKNQITAKVDPNEEIYQSIMAAYPYLNKGFIKSAYSQKQEIENQYAEGERYVILHRALFADLDELHEFVEIMMSHDYSINADEKKMIVDTFREFVNDDGVILSNILSIANQVKILGGEYEGYCVIGIE